jgi:type IV pilus assembly protein PilM
MLSPEGIINNGLLNVEIATNALRYLLDTLDLGNHLSGVSIVESSTVVSRNLMLPYLTPEDLNSMVHMEIQRLFADVLQNYMVDYTCLNITDAEDGTGKQANVMVFALPENVYQSYFDMFENCGVNQYILDILPNSTSRILRQRTFINEELCSPGDTFAFVDMGHMSTSIIIVSKGVLAFTRTLQRGGNNITMSISEAMNLDYATADKLKIENADILATDELNLKVTSEVEEIIGEVQRVFRYYLSSQGSNGSIDKIFIYGGTSHIANLDSYMAQELGISVSKIDTLNFMNLKHSLPLDCSQSDFLNAAGALMRI